MRYVAGLTLALGLLACGPVESTAVILEADVELESARIAQAPSYAPYEYVSAEAYLWKARELQGFADYQMAIAYANKSLERAKAATAKAMASKKTEKKEP